MLTAKEQLAHLAECLGESEAEQLLVEADRLGMLSPLPCPSCGERAMDRLVWDDESIVCGTCATTFDPNAVEALISR